MNKQGKIAQFFTTIGKKDNKPDFTKGMAFDSKVMAERQKRFEASEKKNMPDAKFQIENNDSDSDEEKKTPIEGEGEVMSSSSEEEEQTTGQMLDKQEVSSSSESSESSSSSETESEEYYDEEVESIEEAKNQLPDQKLQFTRPKQKFCVQKLPKVGDLVNLNSFDCYLAVRKLQKPLIFTNNAHFEHPEEELSTVGSDGSSSSQGSNLPQKKSFFKKMVAKMKKNKEFGTQTTRKNTVRFITMQNGRILVVKQLIDKIDGDKYSVMRQFPNFQRSMDDKKYTLPTISWNAKITRVYKVEEMREVKVTNQMLDTSRIVLKWQEPFNQPNFQKPNLKEHFKLINETYSKKAFKNTGFHQMSDLDNTYEILTSDLPDLMLEINDEKMRRFGVSDPIKIV